MTKSEQSRSTRLRIQQERMDREFVSLRTRWRQLVADGRIATARTDRAAMQRIARQIATFYRDCGALDATFDSMLNEAAGFVSVVFANRIDYPAESVALPCVLTVVVGGVSARGHLDPSEHPRAAPHDCEVGADLCGSR